MKNKKVEVGKILFSNDLKINYIAGTCIIESPQNYISTIAKLVKIFKKNKSQFVAKASFDKANRSSINSFRGIGIDKSLEVLRKVKKIFNIPILVDIHLPQQAEMVSDVCDIIQIPAFLSRQTDIIVAAAKTKKAINIKKAQFMSPWEIENVIKKIEHCNNYNILITERGTIFGYNNLVVDMRSFEIIKKFGYPVIFDATHSVQKPAILGDRSGGDREFIPVLSRAAVSCKIAGIFFETHINPNKALSDGPNAIALKDVEAYISTLNKIDKLIKSII